MDFDDITEKYDAWFTTPLGGAVDRWEKDVTWTLAQPVPGEKVLDIGTGTANYLIELAERGLDCTGLDIGLKMLLRGRKKALERGIKLKLVTASGEALPFPDGLFDLVLSVTAFEFFENPVLTVQEMTRVCRPGGRIVVSVLNKWSIWAARRRVLSWFRNSIFTHCRFYSCYRDASFFRIRCMDHFRFRPSGNSGPAYSLLQQTGAAPSEMGEALRRLSGNLQKTKTLTWSPAKCRTIYRNSKSYSVLWNNNEIAPQGVGHHRGTGQVRGHRHPRAFCADRLSSSNRP